MKTGTYYHHHTLHFNVSLWEYYEEMQSFNRVFAYDESHVY